jgi:hypothetical protein
MQHSLSHAIDRRDTENPLQRQQRIHTLLAAFPARDIFTG